MKEYTSAVDRLKELNPIFNGGLPALRPAWALADMIAKDGWDGCGTHPDDIDTSAIDITDWNAAVEAFNIQDAAADLDPYMPELCMTA